MRRFPSEPNKMPTAAASRKHALHYPRNPKKIKTPSQQQKYVKTKEIKDRC
jgi:hypothetical protein